MKAIIILILYSMTINSFSDTLHSRNGSIVTDRQCEVIHIRYSQTILKGTNNVK